MVKTLKLIENVISDIVMIALILTIATAIFRLQIAEIVGTNLGLKCEYSSNKSVDEMADFFEEVTSRGYSFCFVKYNEKEALSASRAVYEARPENFAVNVYYIYMGKDSYFLYFYQYLSDKEREYEWNECNRIADSIIESMPEGLSQEEQLKYAHDYLCRVNDSKTSSQATDRAISKYNMYTLFTEGLSLCEGYTQAYSLLLTKLNVNNGINMAKYGDIFHVWNNYEINGSTYYTDVTWDDCCADGDVIYDNSLGLYLDWYFNKDGEEFSESHIFSKYTPAVINTKVVSEE